MRVIHTIYSRDVVVEKREIVNGAFILRTIDNTPTAGSRPKRSLDPSADSLSQLDCLFRELYVIAAPGQL
jgi:hypothetical protein